MAELTILRGGERLVHTFQPPRPLSDVLAESGFDMPRPCGGRGVCGKCAVGLTGRVSPPNAAEQKAGTRLACQAEQSAERYLSRICLLRFSHLPFL